MTTTATDGPVIKVGYIYRNRLTLDAATALFPSGCRLIAHVRGKRSAAQELCVLTTENGRITRLSDAEIAFQIPAAATATMAALSSVQIDFVRVDQAEPEHLQITLTIPVEMPVTRAPVIA